MSFFDEVETTVANTRFLQAIEDHGPIVLQFKPLAQLAELDVVTRPKVDIDLLLRPNTTSQYLFKQYLCVQKDEDSVHLLTSIEQYQKVAGRQRRILGKKLFSDHDCLRSGSSSSSSSSGVTGSAAAYVVVTANGNGNGGEEGQTNGHPQKSPKSSSAAVGGAPTPTAPALPCLEHILATPPKVHGCCTYLLQQAASELKQIQQQLENTAQPPPVTLFDSIYVKIRSRLNDRVEGFLKSPFYLRFLQLEDYETRASHPHLSQFRIFRVLGRGAFGAVSAVQKIDTHAIYAMKEMGKRQVKADQSEWMVLNERKVLAKMNSPFVLNLKYSFHEDDTLYLIFDMCAGGDLKFHLRASKDKCFDLARARFYAAEVLLGLEHIHSHDIVYRDLKPNNILLHQNGHVCISDLGLTIKLRKNKVLKHLAGTAGYWSVEILQKTGTYKTSDYWSFGVMLYEMLTGKRPNCTCDKKTKQWCPFGQKRSMEENALDPEGVLCLDIPYPPDKITPAAKDLLQLLFEIDPLKRLGAGGIHEIKNHEFFNEIDWEALACGEVTPPYVPDPRTVNANSIGEVGEFNKGAFKNIALTPEDDKMYAEFAYASPAGVQMELVEALSKMDNPESNNHPNNASKGDSGTGGCCTIL